jgi:hypothetical protein
MQQRFEMPSRNRQLAFESCEQNLLVSKLRSHALNNLLLLQGILCHCRVLSVTFVVSNVDSIGEASLVPVVSVEKGRSSLNHLLVVAPASVVFSVGRARA